MATLHLFDTYALGTGCASGVLGAPRALTVRLAHLPFMDPKADAENPTTRPQLRLIEQVLSLSELCAHLQVTAQTIYDLRSQGRGPRGFRVGRELRFRISEVEAWLARMEHADERKHPSGRL